MHQKIQICKKLHDHEIKIDAMDHHLEFLRNFYSMEKFCLKFFTLIKFNKHKFNY